MQNAPGVVDDLGCVNGVQKGVGLDSAGISNTYLDSAGISNTYFLIDEIHPEGPAGVWSPDWH